MRFVVRVLIGVALSAIALTVFLLTVGPKVWAIATGAVLAPIGFLGSFFLWSADRPEEGYEQVLFDRPNSLTSLALVAVLGGAAFGAGLFLDGDNVDPAEAAYLQQRDLITDLAVQYQADADLYRTGKLVGDPADTFGEHRGAVDDILLGLDDAGVTDEARAAALKDAAQKLRVVTGAMESCVGGDEGACMTARIDAMIAYQASARALA